MGLFKKTQLQIANDRRDKGNGLMCMHSSSPLVLLLGVEKPDVRTVSLRLVVAPAHHFYSVACCRK